MMLRRERQGLWDVVGGIVCQVGRVAKSAAAARKPRPILDIEMNLGQLGSNLRIQKSNSFVSKLLSVLGSLDTVT
jgi:hypothetical protein